MAIDEELSLDDRQQVSNEGRGTKLKTSEIESALQYLTNPTSVGLNKLKVKWLYASGITEFIDKMSGDALRRKNSHSESYDRRRKQSIKDSESLTFIYRLFNKLHEKSMSGNWELDEANFEQLDYRFHWLDLDYKKIAEEYQDALAYFSKHIYFEGFSGKVTTDLSKIKPGPYVVTTSHLDSRNNAELEIVAFNSDVLRTIVTFLQLIGKVERPRIYTVYSPEEELLSPYIEVAKAMLEYIDMSDSLAQHYEKMIADFDNKNFTGCVSTAGLVAEELLTQLYETLSRRPAPKNVMLGRIHASIGELARELQSPAAKVKAPSKSQILQKTKDYNKTSDTQGALNQTANDLINYIDSKYDIIEAKFNERTSGNLDFSLFPNIIRLSLGDVILYRNNASHKSTYPIGSLEALKSVYGSLSLLIWWDVQKLTIDGSKSQAAVLRDLISASEKYS